MHAQVGLVLAAAIAVAHGNSLKAFKRLLACLVERPFFWQCR
jgi:hypothetical protein